MDNQQIRSFIAIELPGDLRAKLLQLQTKLKSSDFSFVKWVAPEAIHLTLKFLGSIPLAKVDEISSAMAKASEIIPPFELETAELGVFPNVKRPSVFWVGIRGDLDKLATLQKRIDDILEPKGFPKEKRAFTPHLTLARIRETASLQNKQAFGEMIVKTSLDVQSHIRVSSISLMRSQLLPGGAVYSRLSEVTLSLRT